ncbi:MFS transporter [Pseudonocardia sp. MCCB 268]|nr:MFS transporter [Pseudonocardia cytotoxica]
MSSCPSTAAGPPSATQVTPWEPLDLTGSHDRRQSRARLTAGRRHPTRPGRTRASVHRLRRQRAGVVRLADLRPVHALLSLQFFPARRPHHAALLGTPPAIFGVGFFFRPLGGWFSPPSPTATGVAPAWSCPCSLMASGAVLIGPHHLRTGRPGRARRHSCWPAPTTEHVHRGRVRGRGHLSPVRPDRQAGAYGSLLYISANLGALAAVGTSLTDRPARPAAAGLLGWRIPFLLGGTLGLVALVLRRRIAETEAFRAVRPGGTTPARQLLRRHPAPWSACSCSPASWGLVLHLRSYLPVHLRSQGMPHRSGAHHRTSSPWS